MESDLEGNFLVREMNEKLHKKKYKFVLKKVEKIFETNNHGAGCSVAWRLAIIQSHAANKLLERNIVKKEPYRRAQVQSLISLLTRNLLNCRSLLTNWLRKTDIIHANYESSSSTNNYQNNSSVNFYEQQYQKQWTYNPRPKEGNTDFVKFFNMAQESYLLVSQTCLMYDLHFRDDWQFADFIRNMKFKDIENKVLQMKILLCSARSLVLQGKPTSLSKAIEFVNQAIDTFFDATHLLNLKLIKESISEHKRQKYKKCKHELYRLLAMCFVLMIRSNMKLGQQHSAMEGIRFLTWFFDNLEPQFISFKKLLMPEMAIQNKFVLYYAAKKQIIQIISPYFQEHLLLYKQQLKSSKICPMILHFNNEMYRLNQRAKQASIITQQRREESYSTKRLKSTTTITPLIRSNHESSHDLLDSFLFHKVEKTNDQYLKEKQSRNIDIKPKLSLSLNQPSHFIFKGRNQISGQRQRKSSVTRFKKATICNFSERNKQNSSFDASNLVNSERHHFKKVSFDKQILKMKKKEILIEKFHELCPQNQEIKKQVSEKIQLAIIEKRMQDQKVKLERNDTRPNKKSSFRFLISKGELFLGILLKNKSYLGITKLAEKIEFQRKKAKQKIMVSTKGFKLSNATDSRQMQKLIQQNSIKHLRKVKYEQKKQQLGVIITSVQQVNHDNLAMASVFTACQRNITLMKQKLQMRQNVSDNDNTKQSEKEALFRMKLNKTGSNFYLAKKEEEKQNA